MTARRPWPLLIVGLMGLLAVGAVVLGLAMAPSTPDLLVHNGAGELLYAPSLTALYSNKTSGEYIRIVWKSPDHATESLLKGGPGSPAVRTVHVKGARASETIVPLTKMQTVTGFEAKGSDFAAQQPASSLFTAQRAPQVKGTVKYLVTLHGQFLVNVVESFNITTPVGTQTGAYQFRVTTIGGQPVPSH
jgi:hypothetical protein